MNFRDVAFYKKGKKQTADRIAGFFMYGTGLICLLLFVVNIFVVFSTVAAGAASLPELSEDSTLEVTAVDNMQEYAEATHPGWNLGNTLDAPDGETAWGNPRTTKRLIEEIAAAGFNSIRIPVTWDQRIGPGPDYRISSDFMERVQEVVDWALEEDLYVMLNMHHDTDWIIDMEDNYEQVLDRYCAVWEQVSAHFKDYPVELMFEAINEPRFSEDWEEDQPIYFEMLHDLNTSFQQIVRKSGSVNKIRPLVLSTLTGSGTRKRLEELAQTMKQLDDDRLIATIHYYGYWPFSVNIAGETTFSHRVRRDIETTFERAHETFVKQGIPVIVGEYGLLGFDKSIDTVQRGEILKFFEYVSYYGRKKGLPLMLWDNGQHFDRENYVWNDQGLYNVIKEGVKTRSSYTETDLVFIQEGQQIEDKTLQLHLHGNRLLNIYSSERRLIIINGYDYLLEDGFLVLKDSFLERVAAGKDDYGKEDEEQEEQYGLKETLTLEFSAGADWELKIIYYDTPKMGEASGSVNRVFIPVAFNGDRLATMEAVYADSGDNTGPADWTPFKEYNHAFSPHHDSDMIVLEREFLRELEDGEILLTFHFWSGEQVEYLLHREGRNLSGEPL